MGDDEKEEDDDDDDDDDDHLLDLNDALEPLPDAWLSKWPRAHKWFGPNRERLNPRANEIEDMDEDFKNDKVKTWQMTMISLWVNLTMAPYPTIR
jgi:hypothetical protein